MGKHLAACVCACALFASIPGTAFGIVVIDETFTDVSTLELFNNPEQRRETFQFNLTNSTGEIWTDFHFVFDLFGGSITYTGPGTTTVAPEQLDVVFDVDALIPDGGVYSFLFDYINLGGDFGAGLQILGTPTFSAKVGEPATLALLVFALAGMGLARRHALMA